MFEEEASFSGWRRPQVRPWTRLLARSQTALAVERAPQPQAAATALGAAEGPAPAAEAKARWRTCNASRYRHGVLLASRSRSRIV